MREIHEHKVDGEPLPLTVAATDAPGNGGANHEYEVTDGDGGLLCRVVFQNGAVKVAGINGVSHEALLVIVADRLRSFQAGPYACKENAEAWHHIGEAMTWLQSRTKARLARSVEGTQEI